VLAALKLELVLELNLGLSKTELSEMEVASCGISMQKCITSWGLAVTITDRVVYSAYTIQCYYRISPPYSLPWWPTSAAEPSRSDVLFIAVHVVLMTFCHFTIGCFINTRKFQWITAICVRLCMALHVMLVTLKRRVIKTPSIEFWQGQERLSNWNAR